MLATLSAFNLAGVLTISDASALGVNNALTIVRDGNDFLITDAAEQFITPAPAGMSLENGDLTLRAPASLFNNLAVNLGGGGDTLTLDLASGDVVPNLGLSYDAGESAENDSLLLFGGDQGAALYDYTSAEGGSVQLENFGAVSYTALESLTNTGTATTSTFKMPTGANSLELKDDGDDDNNLLVLNSVSATFVSTTFRSPSTTLAIDPNVTGDALTVGTLPQFGANLTLGASGDLLQTITFNGGTTFATDRNLSGFAKNRIRFENGIKLALDGSGSASLTTLSQIEFLTASGLSTVDGNLLLSANETTGGNSIGAGVSLAGNAVLQSTGRGNVSIYGKGGEQPFSSFNYGVLVIGANARIAAATGTLNVTGLGGGRTSTGSGYNVGVMVNAGGSITGGSGAVTINGTGGGMTTQAGSTNDGVRVESIGSRISSVDGSLTVTGNGGNGYHGVILSMGGEIAASGSGDVNVLGVGGNAEAPTKVGVALNGPLARIASAGGKVRVEGRGGGGAATANNFGVWVTGGGTIAAGGLGTTTVMGKGDYLDSNSGNTNYGVYLSDSGSRITSGGGAVSVAGTGGGRSTSISNAGVYLNSQAEITAGGTGSVTVVGNGAAVASGAGEGVLINSQAKVTSGGGPVLVQGMAGAGSAGRSSRGVVLTNNATITAGGLAGVTVEGWGATNAAATTSDNTGIYNAGVVTSSGGDIVLRGWGGGVGSASGTNEGVSVSGGAVVAVSNASISITGTGGNQTGTLSGQRNVGVRLSAANVTALTGTITITGTGGGAGSFTSGNSGILLGGMSTRGLLMLNGTGGAGTSGSMGVEFTGYAQSLFNTVRVTGSVATKSTSNFGIAIASGGVLGSANVPVGIELIADSMSLNTNNNISTGQTGMVVVRPLTPGFRINLGVADSPDQWLGIWPAELSAVSTGTFQIGDSNSGDITLGATVTNTNNSKANIKLSPGTNKNFGLNGFGFNLQATQSNTSLLTASVTGTGAIVGNGGLSANTVTVLAESGNIGSQAAPISVLASYFNAQTAGSVYFTSTYSMTTGSLGISAGGVAFLVSGVFQLMASNSISDTTSLYLGQNATLGLAFNYQDTVYSIAGDLGSRIASYLGDEGGTLPRLTIAGETGTYDLKSYLGDINSYNLGLFEIVKRGGSTLLISGLSDLKTVTRIEGGVLVAQLSTSLGSSTAYTRVLPGGSLRLNNTSVAIASEPLRLSGMGYLTDAALSVNSITGAMRFNGPITLEGDASMGGPMGTIIVGGVIDDGNFAYGLQKTGGSAVVLNGINLYDGPTTVREGYLQINGSIKSPTTVEATASLYGSGTIHHQLTVNSGGALDATLTINRPGLPALAINGGAKLTSSFAAGTNTSLTVNGSITLGSAGVYPRLDLIRSTGFAISASGKYILMQNDGNDPIDGFFTAGFGSSLPVGTVLPEGAAITGNFLTSGMAATISYVGGDGNDVEITINNRPTINILADQTVNEDAAATTINLSGITSGGITPQALQVTATSNNTTLIANPAISYASPATTGTLTFTPEPNRNGTSTIDVTVRDAGLDGVFGTLDDSTNATKFTITVAAVNDAPSFVKGSDISVTSAFAQTRPGWATSISPGANESAQVVDFQITGNTKPELFSVLPAMAANGTLTFTPALGQYGSATVTLRLHDNGGTALGGVDTSETQTFTIDVSPPQSLQVLAFLPTTTGGVVHLSQPIDPSVLNLYDVQGNRFGAADVVIQGASSGVIRGSLVVDPGLQRLTFVSTTGRLPADNYTLTLRSAANGFHDATGELLDGDGDGLAGGDFVYGVTVAAAPASAVTITVPNFSRGPGQPVNLPASGTTGIPLSFSNGGGITSATFEVHYDPTLLNISAATVAPGLPVGATVNLDTTTAGIALIQFNSPTPLTAGTTRFVDLQADVPATAPYRTKQVLDIANISLNAGAVAAIDDDGVQLVAYFADVSGNGDYTGQDASYLARLSVGIDSGLEQFKLLDPLILGDITGNGDITSQDVSLMLQLAVSIPVAEVPTPLPTGSFLQGGPDPKLSIPQNLVASPGESLIIPVDIDSIVNLTGNGLASADLVIYYDPSVLEITEAALGKLVASRGWLLSSHINPLAGRIDLSLAGLKPLEGTFRGELAQLQATVKAAARPGASAINLAATSRQRSTQLNEGFLTLIPAPTDAANDPIDGRVTIRSVATPVTTNIAQLVGEQLLITGSAANDRIIVGHLPDGRLRVRVGNQHLGDFAATGVAIDAQGGDDFVYVAPTAPAVVIAANIDALDQIFGGESSKVVLHAHDPAASDSSTPLSLHEQALLQILSAWQQDHSDASAASTPRRSMVRRLS